MGRPRKIVEGPESETLDDADYLIENQAAEPVGDGRRAYIKNGVTILRDPSGESELLSDGWARK